MIWKKNNPHSGALMRRGLILKWIQPQSSGAINNTGWSGGESNRKRKEIPACRSTNKAGYLK